MNILSPSKHKELLRVFMGKKWISNHVVFHEDDLASIIRDEYFLKVGDGLIDI